MGLSSLLKNPFAKSKAKSQENMLIEAKVASRALSAKKGSSISIANIDSGAKPKRPRYTIEAALEAMSLLEVKLTGNEGLIKVPSSFAGAIDIYASTSKESDLAIIVMVDSLITKVHQYKLHTNRIREDLKQWYAAQNKARPINIRILLTDEDGLAKVADKYDIYDQEKKHSLNSNKFDGDIDSMLIDAHERNVSDIHVEVRKPMGRIRFRIHGELYTYKRMKYEDINSLANVIFSTKAQNQGSNYSPTLTGYKASADLTTVRDGASITHRLRLQTVPHQQITFDVVSRRLPSEAETADLRLENLGYLPRQLEIFDRAMRNKKGIIMFAGETGSGKTTSCTACVQQFIRLNTSSDGELRCKVITVEDPVEIQIEGATQIAIVGTDGADNQEDAYSNALSWILRSDPDTVMVSEIRTKETALNVVKGVQTGIPMVSTIHASSALGIIARSRNIGMGLHDIAVVGFFKVLCHQALVQVVCKECSFTYFEMDKFRESLPKAQHGPFTEMMVSLKGLNISTEKMRFRNRSGCVKCSFMGVSGRTPIAEVIEPTPEILQLISDGKSYDAEKLWYKDPRNYSLVDHALYNVEAGIVDPFSFYNSYGNFSPTNWKPVREARN